MVELHQIPPPRAAEVLPAVEAFLKAASDKTRASDWQNDKLAILRGVALLWVVWDGEKICGAVTTETPTLNGVRYCYVTAVGGFELSTWVHLLSEIEDYAKRHGCAAMRSLARRGWLPLLPDYQPKLVLIEKGL